MRIDGSGNVGVGATAPANTRLYVFGSDVSNPVQILVRNNNAGGSRFLLQSSGGTSVGALTYDNNNGRLSLDSLAAVPILFRTNNITAMAIDTSQNVGIGTAAPAAKLDVNGSIFSTGIKTNLISSGRLQTHTSGSGFLNIGGSGFVVIHGFIASNEFWDVIIAQIYGSLNVISSAIIGSPPTRTYSMNQSGQLGLSMSGGTAGTYTINTHQMS
jgi:hypothetical protein